MRHCDVEEEEAEAASLNNQTSITSTHGIKNECVAELARVFKKEHFDGHTNLARWDGPAVSPTDEAKGHNRLG